VAIVAPTKSRVSKVSGRSNLLTAALVPLASRCPWKHVYRPFYIRN
jgi:hypothetical protein